MIRNPGLEMCGQISQNEHRKDIISYKNAHQKASTTEQCVVTSQPLYLANPVLAQPMEAWLEDRLKSKDFLS